jgi:amino acid transporter
MSSSHPTLPRHLGLWQATALNVAMIVGAGVFITIPLMLKELPGPAALLGWIAAGVLMIADGLIWSELGAMMPGSGGSYRYLLEAYGRERWGRLMAFLFVWQFLLSGPLEVGSGLIALATFSNGLHPAWKKFNQDWTWELKEADIGVTVSPARLMALFVGAAIVALLYRRATTLGRLTVAITVGVIAVIGWILVDGILHFDLETLTAASVDTNCQTPGFAFGLGKAMILAMYAYLGYYNVCYVGDEVCEPGKTIPRAILLSAVSVCVLFVGVHVALLGTVAWTGVPTTKEALDDYSLPAEFAQGLHGSWAAGLMSLLLMGSCFASAFAGLLSYSRIPFGAAHYGHFFRVFERVHPTYCIPHVSLVAVGAITLVWTFFDLEAVIAALLTLRILVQFVGQAIGVMLLRKARPDRPRPYRIWLYPLPCLLALVGWLYLYVSAGWLFIGIGAATLTAGVALFVLRALFSWQSSPETGIKE